jgi:hypothetical protein
MYTLPIARTAPMARPTSTARRLTSSRISRILVDGALRGGCRVGGHGPLSRLPPAPASGACCPRDGASGCGPGARGAASRAHPFAASRWQGLLGAGGFAAVWEATASGAGPPLAVKVSHTATPETGRRFAQEAELLARVGPPHVPALIGIGGAVRRAELPGDGSGCPVPACAAELAGWPEHPPLAAAIQLAQALLTAVAAVQPRRRVRSRSQT